MSMRLGTRRDLWSNSLHKLGIEYAEGALFFLSLCRIAERSRFAENRGFAGAQSLSSTAAAAVESNTAAATAAAAVFLFLTSEVVILPTQNSVKFPKQPPISTGIHIVIQSDSRAIDWTRRGLNYAFWSPSRPPRLCITASKDHNSGIK